jgi:hypothetical protein
MRERLRRTCYAVQVGRRVVSFSLWGAAPKYTVGAVRNAELAPSIYPGWEARFYVGTSVPVEVVARLEAHGAVVVRRPEPGDWRGMFWRFLPVGEPDVEVMIVRDADSRLGAREAAAVEAWLASGRPFHIMRDHPWHEAPILGGMWGVRRPLLADIEARVAAFNQRDRWQTDQEFLARVVFPEVAEVALVHDEIFDGRPFPTPRQGLEFVGQVYDEKDVAHAEYARVLEHHLKGK